MTFLEIVRRVAQRTGTGDPRTITAAITATGRTATVAALVQDAWTQIQGMHEQWRFLIANFPEMAMLTTGTRAYTAGNLNLADWAGWIPGDARGTVPMSTWPDEAGGRTKERPLAVLGYRGYRQTYETGAYAADPIDGQPAIVAVDTQDRLVVWPVPEANYHLSGTYRRTPQVFAADGDSPRILPAHHQVLVSAGALAVHRFDEAPTNTLVTAQQYLDGDVSNLRRRYLYGTGVVVGAAALGPTGADRGIGRGAVGFPFPDVDEVRGRFG